MKYTIYDPTGSRLYLTPEERRNFLGAASCLPPQQHAFCVTLALTGCRISEALYLTHDRLDHQLRVVVFETLKKRRRGHFRTIPVPQEFLRIMQSIPAVEQAVRAPRGQKNRLWPWCRTTGYTVIKETMSAARITGPQACPKGLRHGFAIHALSKGVPLNMIQRWMGHSSIEITSIYLQAVGDEEYRLAELMWAS